MFFIAKSPEIELLLKQWTSKDLESSILSQYGNLKDWHVVLAASTNYSLWKSTCKAFAKQLEENNDPIKASSYYLMIHDIDKAIQVLVQANFFHAALAIAKSRLDNDHPMINDLYKQWAQRSMQDGLYELASKCWYMSGFPINSGMCTNKCFAGSIYVYKLKLPK